MGNGDAPRRRQFSIISGATSSVAKRRRRSMNSGNFARLRHGSANSRSHSSKEWWRISRRSTNVFAVTAKITNFAVSQRLIAMFSGWRSMRCFFETTFRQSSQSMKRIELAKTFGGAESGRFVNGILDRVRKDLDRPAREAVKKES